MLLEQLNSDIRAREQRNDIVGDQTDRADSDLVSEVRSKLEANIPRGKLVVEAEHVSQSHSALCRFPHTGKPNATERDLLGTGIISNCNVSIISIYYYWDFSGF